MNDYRQIKYNNLNWLTVDIRNDQIIGVMIVDHSFKIIEL